MPHPCHPARSGSASNPGSRTAKVPSHPVVSVGTLHPEKGAGRRHGKLLCANRPVMTGLLWRGAPTPRRGIPGGQGGICPQLIAYSPHWGPAQGASVHKNPCWSRTQTTCRQGDGGLFCLLRKDLLRAGSSNSTMTLNVASCEQLYRTSLKRKWAGWMTMIHY